MTVLGYDSHNPMLNLGTISVVIIFYLVKVVLLFTVGYPLKTLFPDKFTPIYEK